MSDSEAFVRALAAGERIEPYLEAAGEPEPKNAAQAFARAALHLDLARQVERWAAPLLVSARPGFGAQSLEALARAHREQRGEPLELARAPLLPSLLGSSNFLARLLLREPAWVDELAGAPPDPPSESPSSDWTSIRNVKYRGLLRVAARDLAGRDFVASLRELSDLADGCLAAALARSAEEAGVAPPALFALGKLGGRELNFSSDVDLLFVYDVPAGQDDLAHNHAVARLVRRLKAGLEEPSEDGFAYRVDLDLRPEGPTGALANSVEAALAYYENFGAEWERQALLRLRHVAGPPESARRFTDGLVPFVYRRSIDPRVLQGVRSMKARIEDERRRAGRDLDCELKEGPGGIRDVEFLVQALQLLFAGRHPETRATNLLEALAALARVGVVEEETEAALRDAYLWLRRAEHALQMVEERQTQRMPSDPAGQLALARRMGYAELAGGQARARLLDDWTAVRSRVRTEFEALVLRTDW